MEEEIRENKRITFNDILNNKYFESYKSFWVPILKKQVFMAKMENDFQALIAIKEHIYKSIPLKERRFEIVKELDLVNIKGVEDL